MSCNINSFKDSHRELCNKLFDEAIEKHRLVSEKLYRATLSSSVRYEGKAWRKNRGAMFQHGSNAYVIKAEAIRSRNLSKLEQIQNIQARLFAFLITFVIWLAHWKMLHIVTPKILALSTSSISFELIRMGGNWFLTFFKSIFSSLHLLISI